MGWRRTCACGRSARCSTHHACARRARTPSSSSTDRGQHPQWVLHTADGEGSTPVENAAGCCSTSAIPTTRPSGRGGSAESLTAARVDRGGGGRGQRPGWSGVAADRPAHRAADDRDDRATTWPGAGLVRGAMSTQGWSLVAQNGPPEIIEPDEEQIGSTDAVLTATGFARHRRAGLGRRSAATSGAAQPRRRRLDHRSARGRRRASGCSASRPTCWSPAAPSSAYSPTTLDDPLYRVPLGAPTADVRRAGGRARGCGRTSRARWPSTRLTCRHGASLGTFGTITLPGRAVRRDRRPYVPVGRARRLLYSEPARATERFCAGQTSFERTDRTVQPTSEPDGGGIDRRRG